jgi:hypothetical protein
MQPTIPIVLENLQRIVFVLVKAVPLCNNANVRNDIAGCLKYACTQIKNVNPSTLVVGLTQEEVTWLQNMLNGSK